MAIFSVNATSFPIANFAVTMRNVLPDCHLRANPTWISRKELHMKQLNYDTKTLIMMNVKPAEKPPVPEHFTRGQYKVLCRVIIQKRIEKRFFDFIVSGLFEKSDWKTLTYSEMYLLIHTLSHYDYRKGEEKNG